MKRPDFWNWPPFMTVRRHNRIVTDIIEQAQQAIDGEHARTVKEGRRLIHDWAIEVNWNLFHGLDNLFGGTRTDAQARAALQQAEHVFNPGKTDLKEAVTRA